jgi:hypothetical protein
MSELRKYIYYSEHNGDVSPKDCRLYVDSHTLLPAVYCTPKSCNIVLWGPYFIRQVLFVTYCQLAYHINLVLSVEKPMCGAGGAGSDKW